MIGSVDAGNGFWDRDPQFKNSGLPNPWEKGSRMAPFDQPFFIIMNLAVGGVNYFGDSLVNQPYAKPWSNTSPRGKKFILSLNNFIKLFNSAMADFWKGRDNWLPTWNSNNSDDSHFQIDYVRVWAL